jgi:hypothetical protein
MLSPITGNDDLDVFLRFLMDSVQTNTNPVVTDTVTGVVQDPTSEEPVGYLYKYLHVKYADNNQGAGLSDLPAGKAFYGLRNSRNTAEPTNPSDYSWFTTPNGFGANRKLWYLIRGGRQIDFFVGEIGPLGYQMENDTPINLDTVIGEGVIVGSFLADDSVSSAKIIDKTIIESKYGDNSIPETAFKDDSIPTSAFKNNSVTPQVLQSGLSTVTTSAVTVEFFNDTAVSTLTEAITLNSTLWGTDRYTLELQGYIEIEVDTTDVTFVGYTLQLSRGAATGTTIKGACSVIPTVSHIPVLTSFVLAGDSSTQANELFMSLYSFQADGTPATNITKATFIGSLTIKKESFL